MAIIKAGFTKGFRGRNSAASFGRRAHYLSSEHDRAGVVLLDQDREGLDAKAAIERMGGSEAEYHEIIVSPSHLECKAILQYGSLTEQEKAATETARRLSETYAGNREYVTAVHWSDDGRFHFHITVKGPEEPGTLGERGQFQKVWNAQWIHQPKEHRVRDWDLHGKAKELQSQAITIAKDQREATKARNEEIKGTPQELRGEVMDRWREKETQLAAHRLDVETQAIEARYESRGIPDSILKEVEIEKAQIRYQRALNDLDRAEDRIRSNQLVKAYNQDSQAMARQYGKMYREAGPEEREHIKAEYRAAQVAQVDHLAHTDAEKINARHLAAGSMGSLAHKADLERVEDNRQLRLKQADARFEQEEIRSSLTEARRGRDAAIRKAGTPEEVGRIQDEYESRRLDLWEASTAAKVRVTDLDYRIRGTADSEAHIRALARVSEQEGKSLDRAIETDRLKDEMLNLRMELQTIGQQKRETYKLENPEQRDAELSRLNEMETGISQKVMAYELTMLQREYQGKADRVQWQKDREAILIKAREDLQKSAKPEDDRHKKNEEHEEALDKDHEARLALEHLEEEARQEALHRAHEEDAKRAEERDQAEDLARLAAISLTVEMHREEAESPDRIQESAPAAEQETPLEHREPLDTWPEEIRAEYIARAERIQARFQGVQDRQTIDPEIQGKRESLAQLQDTTREELRAPGVDHDAILETYREQAGHIREEIHTLQRDRLDTYFRPRAEGSGIGSEDHRKALQELESRAQLQAVREDLGLERAAVYAQRAEDLKALGHQAERDCLPPEEAARLKEEIHARTEAQEERLALQLREEERRHHHTATEGEVRETEEALADVRLAATLERIGLDREIRGVRDTLRELRRERSEALSQEGADRTAIVEGYEARLYPIRSELERLEAARLDTYHKGQHEERALGSEAHQQAREGLEIQQKAAREREDLQLQQEVNRLDRRELTRGLDAPGDRARREELHAAHDARELAIAARLEDLDHRGIIHAYEEGTPELQRALEDLEARNAAIVERQALDKALRGEQDAIRDQRAATLERLQAPPDGTAMLRDKIQRKDYAEPDRAAVAESISAAVEANPEPFIELYTLDERSKGGRYVGADLFKETFEPFRESKEARNRYNGPVHNSAAVLSSEQFGRMLADDSEPKRDTAILLTGIPGAGKTSSVLVGGELPEDCRVLFEGQLSNFETTDKKVQQALDAGVKPQIVVVHTPPEIALQNTFTRFNEEGRGASIGVMSQIQGGLPDSLQKIHAKYGDSVGLQIVDRRDWPKSTTLEGWEHLEVLRSEGNHEAIRERLERALEHYRAEGTISEACYRQARGDAPLERSHPEGMARTGGPESGAHVHGRGVPEGDRQEAVLKTPREHIRTCILAVDRSRVEQARVSLHQHQAERLDALQKGCPEERSIEAHQRALLDLAARQELQAIREDVAMERQVLNLERREALDRATVQARQELAPTQEARQQREEIHAAHDARELALADRILDAEKAHASRTLEEGTRQHERAQREAEERREAAAERLAIEAGLRQVRDQAQDLRAERSEALAHEGADRAAIVQDYEAKLKPIRAEQERLEAARADTYHKGQPEERALGSEAHQQAREELAARQAISREREGLAVEREVLQHDRQDSTRHVEDREIREAVHERFDGKELELARREAALDRRQADLANTPGSEDHRKALEQVEAKVQAVAERQGIDRQLRQVDDRSQDLREKIRTDLEQPRADRQKILEENRPALREIREEAARLHNERLDARFKAEGREHTPEHQEAREKLAERLEHRATKEDHGLQRAAMSAEKRETLEGLRAAHDQAEERRELLRKVPKIGAVLDLAAKPNTEKQIASREAIHEAHGAKERAHAAKLFEMEKAHLDRTLQPGSKEHSRAVELAESKARAVPERQDIDRELRSIRDQISQVRQEAKIAERRPFADKAEIRAEAQAKVDQLRGRAEELEHRRLAIQTATREPIRTDSPEGRTHQREAVAAREHLSKDHELRKQIDELRQSIAHARTDYQAEYKRTANVMARPTIQAEYKAQELQKVDQIHTLEVARIDAAHAAAGTTGGKDHQADLSTEAARHAEARQATEERDLGRKLSALEAYAHVKTVANLAVNGAAPDRIAKQVESRAVNAAVNAAMDATLGEYAVVAKVARQVLTMGR